MATTPTRANTSPDDPQPAPGIPATPALAALRTAAAVYLDDNERATIERAYAFAAERGASDADLRDYAANGAILAGMRVDVTGIVAGMLQHLVIDAATSAVKPDLAGQVAAAFGPDVGYLIENIAHFTAIERRKGKRVAGKAPARAGDDAPADRRAKERDDQARRAQIETIHKMFMAMGDDPRIVVFKLADHLRLMRDRDGSPVVVRELALEARDIYAPLAARLGMARIEAELEDLAFAQLEPAEFRRVTNLVAQERAEQRDYIERVCEMLKAEAAKIGIEVSVSGRFKHLWSIYRKLVRNGWDIRQIYDLIAFRIIVPDVPDCYAILGQVHALWPPKEDRIKDFIAHPKPNGYQSLHTTVFCLDKRLAEIQIRTREMHQNAEFGIAMHWYYKDAGDTARLDKRLNSWLQQLRDWQSDLRQLTTAQEFVASTREEIGTRSQVFVFTPQGDVKDLPSGSTPVDFAYRIHSDLGDHCAGARIITPGTQVSQRLVPLDYVLESGQIIDIITRKDAHPTRDWLAFVRTHAARSHITRYLKQHERDIYVAIGRERFEREARSAGIGSIEDISDELLGDVAAIFKFETLEDLLAAIGGDTVRPAAVVQEIVARRSGIAPAPVPADDLPPITTPLPSSEAVLNLAGAGGLLARLANCCHPLPGDEIEGYISRGRGIVIHHRRCRSLMRLREREEGRLVAVTWDQMRLDRYEAAVIVLARDRTGLMRDVTQQAQEMKINLGSVSSTTSRKGYATILLTLQITMPRQLDDALARMRAIKGVERAERDLRSLTPVS